MFKRLSFTIVAILILAKVDCHAEVSFTSSVPKEISPFVIVEKSYYAYSKIEPSECYRQIEILRENECKTQVPSPNRERCMRDFSLNKAVCSCSLKINIPNFSSNKYSSLVLDKINLTLEKLAQKFVNNYPGFPEQCLPQLLKIDRAYIYSLEHNNNDNALYQRNGYISVKVTNYENYSSTPPLFKDEFLTFDLSNGDKLYIADIIVPTKVSQFYEYVFQQLKSNYWSFYYKNKAENLMEFIVSGKKTFKISKFYFARSKTILYFDPGEIGPREVGVIEIEIPNFFVKEKYIRRG